MTASQPFEVIRWEAPHPAALDFLTRWLTREGVCYETREYATGTMTPELRSNDRLIRVVVSGSVQYSFPGYGVVELHPGDRLDVAPHITYDFKVTGAQPAMLLQAAMAE